MTLFSKEPTDAGIRQFWQDTETQIGEPILAYGLAEYLSGGEEEGPLWGLIYVTATRVFFRHFPQTSWISSLVSSGGAQVGGVRPKKAKERDITMVWPLARFHRLEEPRSREVWWRRIIFGSKTLPVSLQPVTEGGLGGHPVVFSIEHNRKAILEALEGKISR
jgi:hypothetical protein